METKRLQEKYKEFYEYHLQMYKDKYEKITSEELEELFEYYMLYRIAKAYKRITKKEQKC